MGTSLCCCLAGSEGSDGALGMISAPCPLALGNCLLQGPHLLFCELKWKHCPRWVDKDTDSKCFLFYVQQTF